MQLMISMISLSNEHKIESKSSLGPYNSSANSGGACSAAGCEVGAASYPKESRSLVCDAMKSISVNIFRFSGKG